MRVTKPVGAVVFVSLVVLLAVPDESSGHLPLYRSGGSTIDDPLEMYLADVFTLSMNLAGICGLSLPCGSDRNGLPVGLQLMGAAFGEETVFRAAHAYELATDWHQRRPSW